MCVKKTIYKVVAFLSPVSVRKKEGTELGVEIDEQSYVERFPRTESMEKSTVVPKLARGKET